MVRWMKKKEIRFRLMANKETIKQKTLNMPLKALPWLREQLTEMLAKHDGTEQIEKETPAQIPQKFSTIIED